MSTFHPVASSLANFNDTISTISTTRLFIYISYSHQDKPTFVISSQLTLFGDSTVNIKSTRRAFGLFFYLPSMLSCTRATEEASRFWGCGQFPFIKRILGNKRIFPCSFGNKRMRLLTRVYGIITSTINHLHACG